MSALEGVVSRFSAEAIPAQFTTTGKPITLHPEIEVTLLRATQEALNNAHKHASASLVNVTLSYLNDTVILDVEDNGVGLNATSDPQKTGGYGLIAMRERVAQHGGQVHVESEPNEGMTIAVTVPI